MAVLLEGISVVVRRDSVARKCPGGWDGFLHAVPNRTLCYDDQIARVGFMVPPDVGKFIKSLEKLNLTFLDHRKAVDFAVVDQLTGPTTRCDWLQFARVPYGNNGGMISACWFFDGDTAIPGVHLYGKPIKRAGSRGFAVPLQISMPQGWKFDGSISEESNCASLDEARSRFEFLHAERGVEVYRDRKTGEKKYVGRTRWNRQDDTPL